MVAITRSMEERQSGEGSVISVSLNMVSWWDDFALGFQIFQFLLGIRGEAKLAGHENVLSAWELELGSSQGLTRSLFVFGFASDGHQDVSDGDSGGSA